MIPSWAFRSKEPDQATTDSYTDVPLRVGNEPGEERVYFTAPTSGPIAANWKNTGANAIDTRVLGSNNKDLADADWKVAVAEAEVAAGAAVHIEIDLAKYKFYKFQHKAAVGGAQGASLIHGIQKRV